MEEVRSVPEAVHRSVDTAVRIPDPVVSSAVAREDFLVHPVAASRELPDAVASSDSATFPVADEDCAASMVRAKRPVESVER